MKVVLHFPETEKGRAELEKNVARHHAAATMQYIRKLNCTGFIKNTLLDKLIKNRP